MPTKVIKVKGLTNVCVSKSVVIFLHARLMKNGIFFPSCQSAVVNNIYFLYGSILKKNVFFFVCMPNKINKGSRYKSSEIYVLLIND